MTVTTGFAAPVAGASSRNGLERLQARRAASSSNGRKWADEEDRAGGIDLPFERQLAALGGLVQRDR